MSSASDPNGALVQALQRKCNHQADRIDELEERIDDLEALVEILQHKHAEADPR